MLNSTTLPPLTFKPESGETSQKTMAPTNKIGWLHSFADTPGATFDLTIKDSLGRIKFHRTKCGTDTEKFGELINLPTQMGERLEVVVENLKGAKKLDVFLN